MWLMLEMVVEFKLKFQRSQYQVPALHSLRHCRSWMPAGSWKIIQQLLLEPLLSSMFLAYALGIEQEPQQMWRWIPWSY